MSNPSQEGWTYAVVLALTNLGGTKMSARPNPAFEQEPLVIVGDQTGQLYPRDFSISEEGAAISPIERDLHLQNVITHLAARNQAEGFLSFDEPAIRSYGERADVMRQNMERKLRRETHAAKEEFARATGYYALLDAGYPKQEVQRATRSLFSDFLKKYGGARHAVEAQAYRRFLANRVEAHLTGEPILSEAVVETPVEKKELPQLPLLKRLEAIQQDPRAGFLPATTQEVNHVFAWLDTSDIGQQVLEAQDHRQKRTGGSGTWRDGLRTVESILYVVDDYLTNAIDSHEVLADLQLQLADIPNPRITLFDSILDGDIKWVHAASEGDIQWTPDAFAVLARYRDLKEYAQTGTVQGLDREPMRTYTNRWTKEGEGPHKRIEDQYTREEPRPGFKKRIQAIPKSLTISEARELINEALDNEEKRASFMIEQILTIRKTIANKRLFSNVVEIVDTTLEQRRRVS